MKPTEALRAFQKIYLEVVDQLIDHLKSQESDDSCSAKPLTSRSGYAGAIRRGISLKKPAYSETGKNWGLEYGQ